MIIKIPFEADTYRIPVKMIPVARMLVYVVPSVLARIPPSSGVQVLFRLKAEINRLNSV